MTGRQVPMLETPPVETDLSEQEDNVVEEVEEVEEVEFEPPETQPLDCEGELIH